MEQKDELLIQKYLGNQLDSESKAIFIQRVKQNFEFAKEVFVRKQILEAITERQVVNSISKIKGEKQSSDKGKSQFPRSATQKVYSLEELIEMFGVVENYERLLADPTRSEISIDNPDLLSPKNGLEYNQQIHIQIGDDKAIDIRYSIINSKDKTIIKGQAKTKDKESIVVNIQNLKPGRYYLKVKSEAFQMQMRYFFVRKDLMPEDID